MPASTEDALSAPRIEPLLLAFCGILGLIGSVAPTGALIWASLVAEHDFLADTVSDLGRGPHRWIMDSGFFINAASLLALSIGAAHIHAGTKRWTASILCFALLALVIVAIGLWDAFGRTAETDGMSVHTRLTFLLGPLYLIGPILMWYSFRDTAPSMARLFLVSAVLWAVFATAFKLAPDWIDGGLEKLAIAATLLWTVPFSNWMTRRALQARSEVN
ncbi:DUF998 domain-containing protein [Yoonia sp. SDW83-1]|uniref:DUF998 domain-containing protein n=1 Tax=Yoonia sp. SDW83-1 TaxID=3366945 RepID=UPI00398C419D